LWRFLWRFVAGGFSEDDMRNNSVSFRVGKVQAYLCGKIWYLCSHENGLRRRPRVGPDREAARQLAAQVNAQLEVGAPAALSFEPITIAELRRRWLEYYELVLRSSVRTIQRYRTAVMWFSVGSGLAVMRVSSDKIRPSERSWVIISRRSVTG
jgi:hypothetical protein